MFYSSFLKSIPGLLAQPFSIAVIASSGIHAIAGVAVPSFYSGSQPEEPQPVSLLSSSEINQSGLPNLERPPELSLLNQDQLAELKKKSGNKQQGRTVPKLNRNRYSGSAGKKQGLKKNPSQARKQQTTPQQVKKYQQDLNKRFNELRKKDAEAIEAERRRLRGIEKKLQEERQRVARIARQQQQTRPNRDGIKKPTPTPEKQPDNTPANNTPVATNNTDNKRIDISGVDDSQVIPPIALGNEDNEPKETPDISPQLKQNLTFQETLTSDNEANQEFLAWGQSVEQNTGQPVTISEPNLSINGNYPQDACLGEEVLGKRVEGKATYGFTVDAEGKIIGDLKLIRSSGFPILNQQARTEIQTYGEFAKNPEPTPYFVEVDYTYNDQVCSK